MRLSTHGTFKNARSKPVRSKLHDCGKFLDCVTLTPSRLRHTNRTYQYNPFGER